MNKLIYLLSALFSYSAVAAGTVDYLKIDKDIVLFSTTEAKTTARPACIESEFVNLWAVSLNTDEGQGIYNMLLMAISNDKSVEVESAHDCALKTGVESANAMSLTQ